MINQTKIDIFFITIISDQKMAAKWKPLSDSNLCFNRILEILGSLFKIFIYFSGLVLIKYFVVKNAADIIFSEPASSFTEKIIQIDTINITHNNLTFVHFIMITVDHILSANAMRHFRLILLIFVYHLKRLEMRLLCTEKSIL